MASGRCGTIRPKDLQAQAWMARMECPGRQQTGGPLVRQDWGLVIYTTVVAR
jgi:hypothetical protein